MSRWSLSRVSPADPSPAAGGESADLSSRLVRRTAELREARSDQVAAWLRLTRAEDRAAALDWQLESIRASRGYRLIRLWPQARSARALLRLPLDGLRVLTTPVRPPPRPADPGLGGRAEHTRAGWAAYDRRDYETALAEARAILADHPKDYAALDLQQSAHWQRGDLAATVSALSQMRMVHDSPEVAHRERAIIGCARELDPRWRPRVPGPPRPVEPRDGVIMHLLGEAGQASGLAMRSRATVAGQRLAGLGPFAVHLDPGPGGPPHQASDVALTDMAWRAGRIGRELRPSVIHAVTGPGGSGTALVGLALRAHLGRPLVCEVRCGHEAAQAHDAAAAPRGDHGEARRAAETRSLRAADLVVANAEGMRSEILRLGIPEHKVCVVPDGVDTSHFAPGEPSAALRRRCRLDGQVVVGGASRPGHPGADERTLIEATARLRARGRDVVALLVGGSQRHGELAAHPARGGPVIVTGQVRPDQVRDYYMLMDVFVASPVDELAGGLVTACSPLAAMAMGLPLVVPDLPALTELATPGERGLMFTPGDPDALAHAIETLLDHPGLARRRAGDGRQWVLAERSWAANGRRYQDIYGRLLSRWAAGPHATADPG